MTILTAEPIALKDLRKGLRIPEEDFDLWLRSYDWTFHQIAREEYPPPFKSFDEIQLACICADPLLWARSFLREPEDPDHKDPYNFFDYQIESLRHDGGAIHKDAAEIGKTRELVALAMYWAFTTRGGSGLIGAPLQTHLDEIIEAILEQLEFNPDLGASLVRHKKKPHHTLFFSNRFKIDFRPSGFDGIAYRGVHAKTFAIKDEAAKDKNKKQWSEFWRSVKPGCIPRIYSVPDGDRACEFYRLAERAQRASASGDIDKDTPAHIKAMRFKYFNWKKSLMPPPYWTKERKAFYVDLYGGEDSPEYKHNIEGADGDPESSVFPWSQLGPCIKDIPEYRCLKVLVDAGNNEVILNGYKCEYVPGDAGPVARTIPLMDTVFNKSTFFDYDDSVESEFRRVIKEFFVSVPGLKRGGADLGFSGDPSEITVKLIYGKRERLVARLKLKHVTYDQQCQALDALDDLYDPLSITWGTDFGNAGSAVAHDLQGLPQYKDKNYTDRLRGFQFESTGDNVDETGEPIIDAKTEKPARITLKELSTDILTKKMQRLELEYPPDPDIILDYPNHTVRSGGKHRIFKKQKDHLIDSDRAQELALIYAGHVEDIFQC
jgi:hypothetical protein